MPENINLIPSEVVKERSLHNTFNKLLGVSFLVLIIAVILSAGAAYLATSSSQELQNVTNQVSQKEDELKSLEEVERNGSKLVAKLSFVQSLLNNKIYYSNVMDELASRNISGVVLKTVAVSESFDVTISGTSSGTTTLQNYVTQLVAEPDNLLDDARINQVNVHEDSGETDFSILVTADATKLVGEQTN